MLALTLALIMVLGLSACGGKIDQQSEYKGHLQGICKYSEDAASYGSVAYPEGGEGVPEDECAVVVYPDPLLLKQCGYPLHCQKRQEAEECERTCMWYKKRNGHHHCKEQYHSP